MRYKGYEGSGKNIDVTSVMQLTIFVIVTLTSSSTMMTTMTVMTIILVMTIMSRIFKYLLRGSMKQES